MLDLTKLTPEQRITRAKIQIHKQSPFFSYILLHMKVREVTSEQEKAYIPSMAVTNKGELLWRREFINKLSEDELLGVTGHEVMHVALMHMERLGTRDMQLMNVAEDLVVNDILINSGFRLPKEGVIPNSYDHSWEFKGHKILKINEKCAEEVYDELYPLMEKIKIAIKNGQMPGGFDTHIHGKGVGDGDDDDKDGKGQSESSSQARHRRDKWKKIVAEAAQVAKQQGKLPAGLERMIEGVLDSKVNWREKLYKYVVAQIIYDYTWNLPSRRSAALGVYLPRPLKESVEIVVSIDTSGSIGQEELQQFISELKSITESFVNVRMQVIVCDAAVHETYDLMNVTAKDLMEMKLSGGGGTDHRPIYKHVKEKIPGAKVLINFTDGYTSFPENPEDYHFHSLWVIDKRGCAEKDVPFGEVIKIR